VVKDEQGDRRRQVANFALLSISSTSSDSVILRRLEISFMPFQNASSILTLVLRPATTIERLVMGDFMTPSAVDPIPEIN
jgi:hypothetical protein